MSDEDKQSKDKISIHALLAESDIVRYMQL